MDTTCLLVILFGLFFKKNKNSRVCLSKNIDNNVNENVCIFFVSIDYYTLKSHFLYAIGKT